MKRIVLIGVATAAALSTAAFAQTDTTPAPTPATPAKTTTQENVKAPSLRQEVRDSLQKAGFKDISVKADSFVVQAKDKEGRDVTMLLGPDFFTEVMAWGSNGQTSANSADAGPFATVPAKDKLSSEVVGLPVYNNDNKDIGTIKDLAFDNTGAEAYILGVGGFLGMGDHYVAVRPSAINLSYNASDKKWHAEMNTTAAQLKAAPEYKFPTNS